jgi:hypothetical protein
MMSSLIFCWLLLSITTVLSGARALGQSIPAATAQQLYLLAGTPSFYKYPATLYQAVGGKLKHVREVVSESEGLRSVQVGGNVIFLVHPSEALGDEEDRRLRKTFVTVVHADEPLRLDHLVIDTGPDFVIDPYHIATTEPRRSIFDELLPSFKGGMVPGNLKILDVSSDLNAPAPRVKQSSIQEYRTLRLEGDPGGPVAGERFFVTVSGEDLVAKIWDSPSLVIDSVPPFVRSAADETGLHRLYIAAASAEYLCLERFWVGEDWTSGKPGNSTELFVHNRASNQWKTLQLEGNYSRSRLFGSWLAVIVGTYNSDNKLGTSPGAENERNTGGAGGRGQGLTARLPNVRQEYGNQSLAWLPGVLVLQNLEDGRKIRIETNQADSEILSVRGDTVLYRYRVNDTIYEARIVGGALQGASVLVKDEDVPEIHWVFWGPQTEAESR